MPVIKPISLEDCVDFTRKNQQEIKDGTFDILLRKEWMTQLPGNLFVFLVSHCNSAKIVAGESLDQSHPQCAHILAKISQDDDPLVRRAVARNPHTPPSLLVALTTDFFEDVRLAVASNPSLPPETIGQLSQDKSSLIREAVIDNPKTSLAVFNRLSNDRSDNVKNRVVLLAQQTDNLETINLLSKCAHPQVRMGVCQNVRTRFDLLETLFRDENREVHQAVAKRFREMASSHNTEKENFLLLSRLPNETILQALAKNPSLPSEIMEILANHKNFEIKKALSANPNLPQTLLIHLADDGEERIRALIAAMEKTPVHLLEKLSKDPSISIQVALRDNASERQRRMENKLCLDCCRPLTRFNLLVGVRCMECGKTNLAQSFRRT